ncbi:hypothetical protein ACXIZN_26965 [Amycolatopsis sp. TRM77291]
MGRKVESNGTKGNPIRSILVPSILVMLFLVIGLVDLPQAPLLRSLILVFGALWFMARVISKYRVWPDQNGALGPARPRSPTLKQLERDEKEVFDRYGKPSMAYFVKLLAGLPLFLQRVNEEAAYQDRYAHMKTTLTFRYGNSGPASNLGDIDAQSSLLVPLIVTKRGNLFDNLRVTDSAGAIVPTLSQRESRGLLIATLRTMFGMAALEHRKSLGEKNELYTLRAKDENILWNLIQYVVCHGEKLTEQARAGINEHISEIDHLTDEFSSQWRDSIRAFCGTFAEHYVIVAAPVPPGGQVLVVSYEHDIPVQKSFQGRYDRLRARFGLNPYAIDISLTRVLQSDSYHFQCPAPSGQYIFNHRIAHAGTDEWLCQDDFILGREQQYARVYYQSGRPTAHLYVRAQGESRAVRDNDFKTRVDFREVPPGALGVATILALISAVIQCFILVAHAAITSGDQNIGTDLTAFLLAAPAFVAVMLGGITDAANVAGSSLSTYFGFILTMTLSLFSALAYVWIGSHGNSPEFQVSILEGRVPVSLSYVWTPIAAVSTLLALYLIQKTYHEIKYYLNLSN